jgi:hypothetical protein
VLGTNDAEVPPVEGGDLNSATALGKRDHACIDQT